MDVKALYEEQMKLFFNLNSAARDAVYVIFRPSHQASLDDLYDARVLVDKCKEVKKHLDSLLFIKNMKVNASKASTTI